MKNNRIATGVDPVAPMVDTCIMLCSILTRSFLCTKHQFYGRPKDLWKWVYVCVCVAKLKISIMGSKFSSKKIIHFPTHSGAVEYFETRTLITKNFRYLRWRYWTLWGYFGGRVFPYISLTYSLYRWGFLHFRYLKCLVISNQTTSSITKHRNSSLPLEVTSLTATGKLSS